MFVENVEEFALDEGDFVGVIRGSGVYDMRENHGEEGRVITDMRRELLPCMCKILDPGQPLERR